MVDSAGGRSQLAQRTTAAVVLLIAIELIDISAMRRILACGATRSPLPC